MTAVISLAFCSWLSPCAPPEVPSPARKEPTVVTGPVDQLGEIDFEAALNDRIGKDITPEQNANVLIWKALGPKPMGFRMSAKYFERMGIKEPPEEGDYYITSTKFVEKPLRLSEGASKEFFDAFKASSTHPWTSDQRPILAQWLKANEKPLAVIREAVRRPKYLNPIDAPRGGDRPRTFVKALMPTPQMCRDIGAALTARAMLHLGESKADQAWDDLLSCHLLARHTARGPSLIESLFAKAIDQRASQADLAYLQYANLNADQLGERIRDLRSLQRLLVVADQLDLFERYLNLDAVREIKWNDQINPSDCKEDEARGVKALRRFDWEPAYRAVNHWQDRLVAVARTENRAARMEAKKVLLADLNQLDKELSAVSQKREADKKDGKQPPQRIAETLLTTMIATSLRHAFEAQDTADQQTQNLLLAFVLARYRAEAGSYPAKLADLVPKYLPAVPLDLFSGKPLIYNTTPNGYLLYSVGVNENDDNGHGKDDNPAGDDLAVRMPVPKKPQ